VKKNTYFYNKNLNYENMINFFLNTSLKHNLCGLKNNHTASVYVCVCVCMCVCLCVFVCVHV
jgi:hypothetical protein